MPDAGVSWDAADAGVDGPTDGEDSGAGDGGDIFVAHSHANDDLPAEDQ